MTYIVSWDGPSAEETDRGCEVEVADIAELDAVLARIAVQADLDQVPYAAQVHRPDTAGSIMIGVGHAERSMLDWLVPDGLHEYGYEPNLAPWTTDIGFDVYGNWHERPPRKTRITPDTAVEAAREYVRTGQRPACVKWASE